MFVSGRLPIGADTEAFDGEDIRSQTRPSPKGTRAIQKEEGLSMSGVCRATAPLADADEFGAMNEAYAEFFTPRAAFRAAAQPGVRGSESKPLYPNKEGKRE